MSARLRPLWDFDDLEATEARLRARLEAEADDPGRAEVLTQLARVHGLRREFGAGDDLLDEAERLAGPSDAVGALIRLERGRLRRTGGDTEAAYLLFTRAYELSDVAGDAFAAADAAHMAAIAAPDRESLVAWTERGLATGDPYWRGPLLNNLGWELLAADDFTGALDAFEQALEVREQSPDRPAEIAIARYAVAKALRALGRAAEAAAALEQAVAWADQTGRPDGWFHEELALAYADLGDDRAAGQARLALPLLERDDPSLEGERADRLGALAGLSPQGTDPELPAAAG